MSNDLNEALFKNSYTPDSKFSLDFCRSTYPRPMRLFCYIFFSIVIVIVLFTIATGDDIVIETVLILLVSISAFFFPEIRARIDARKMEKGLERLAPGGKAIISTEFYSEQILFTVVEIKENIDYRRIVMIRSSELGLYLYVEGSSEKNFRHVILKKDAFTKGDYGSFVEFLKEKLKDNPKALKGLRKA